MRVFITGASSGIGTALAKHYAASGTQLGLVGRNQERLQQLANELGANCAIYVLDVRDATALQQAAADFLTRFGAPNIVIANAGVSRGTLTEHAEDITAFKAVMDINVMGMVHTFQPFIAAMKQAGSGSLVGIASVAGLRGIPGASAYSASKAAAITYLESLRVELIGTGINVTTICPGYIRTPMTDVNPYPMPFLMEPDTAARKMARIIQKKRRIAITPWQMGFVGVLMRFLPPIVWDWVMRKAPHKPRLDWDWL
ncbi:MAG: SDR family oxidoreductase [Methylophilaceae bacterium]